MIVAPVVEEMIAACLQARLPGPQADACAADIVDMFIRKEWSVTSKVNGNVPLRPHHSRRGLPRATP